jgi:hypothetical protein
LAAAAFEAYDELAGRFEVIICEGAGSPAEINFADGDYVNLGLAGAKEAAGHRDRAISTVAGSSLRCTGRSRCWDTDDRELGHGFLDQQVSW